MFQFSDTTNKVFRRQARCPKKLTTKKLAGHFRAGTRNRKAVESGLAETLTERNNLLDDRFTSETVLEENKDGKDEEKTLIYCNDVSELRLCLSSFEQEDWYSDQIKIFKIS